MRRKGARERERGEREGLIAEVCGYVVCVRVAGPMTRTVADNALMLEAIAGADGLDARCPFDVPRPVPSYTAALGRDVTST